MEAVSELLPLIFCFNAVIFGLSAVYYLRGALKNTEHPEGMGPPANPLFSKISRHLISACAVAFVVFLAAAAGIGIKHEFSDQSQGLRYAGKGEHDKAIASFTKAIAAEPHNSESYLGRANSYSAKGDYDHAIADYGNAIEIEPRGKILFFDKELSVNRNEACAFCHMPQTGFQGAIESSQFGRRGNARLGTNALQLQEASKRSLCGILTAALLR